MNKLLETAKALRVELHALMNQYHAMLEEISKMVAVKDDLDRKITDVTDRLEKAEKDLLDDILVLPTSKMSKRYK